MGRKNGPRHGSMQIWPRRRTNDFLPRINWNYLISVNKNEKAGFLGFISYKAGMASAFVKDSTPDSMTKGKRIIVPVTILECPNMKILSIRFYKNQKVSKEVLNSNLDKELKKVLKLPGKKIDTKKELENVNIQDYQDVRVIFYSIVKNTKIKKTPDISEIALSGKTLQDKLNFIKENLDKEVNITDVFNKGLVDVHGLTKGKGFQGPVKRFGIDLRSHKAEKGQRRPGSIGPWHPIGVPFRVARAGGMGMFKRVSYNHNVVASKKISGQEKVINIKNYGNVLTDYTLLTGSVQGSKKRAILLTTAQRPSLKQSKKQFELIELR